MAREHKIEELRQLIREKTSMIDSLTRQIESQNRREQHVQQNQSGNWFFRTLQSSCFIYALLCSK